MHEDAPCPFICLLKPQSVLQRPQLMRFGAFNLNLPLAAIRFRLGSAEFIVHKSQNRGHNFPGPAQTPTHTHTHTHAEEA